MAGFNLPPGVNVNDIPGNGPELTNVERAEQLYAMLVLNIDEADESSCYDTAELLDELSMLLEFDDAPHSELAVYDFAFRAGQPFVLTVAHQKLILEAVNEWLERH